MRCTPPSIYRYIIVLRKINQLYRKVQVHSHFGKTLHYFEINQSITLVNQLIVSQINKLHKLIHRFGC